MSREHSQALTKNPKQSPSYGYMYDQPKLVVDLPGISTQRKSRSLPGTARRIKSTSSLKAHNHSAKRAKRKYASDYDKGSSSSQEQLYQPTYTPVLAPTGKRKSVLKAPQRQSNPKQTLPIGMNRRTKIPENDEELIIRINNDLDTQLMLGSSS